VISCARLPANPGDQSFFKKRQSDANIDDKTIPPKPATLVIFSSEQPRLAANSSTHNLSAAYHSDFHLPALAASTARVALIRRSFRQSPAVTVLKDKLRLPVLGN